MADILHKETAEYRLRQDTGKFVPPFTDRWFINPPVGHMGGIPNKYWHIDAETLPVREKTQTEKDVVDAAELASHNVQTKAVFKQRLQSSAVKPLAGYSNTVDIAGLAITVNINSVVVADATTIVADPTLTKTVKVCYVFNETSDEFEIIVFERTDGLYEELAGDEEIFACLGEWGVGPAGTELLPV